MYASLAGRRAQLSARYACAYMSTYKGIWLVRKLDLEQGAAVINQVIHFSTILQEEKQITKKRHIT